MMSVLKTLQKEDAPRYKMAVEEFKARDAAYASAAKAHLQAAADPSWMLGGGDMTQLPYVPEQPVPPTKKCLVVSDITSQKLVRMCAERPEGLLCHLDEMQSWCEKLSNSNTGESRAAWIAGYDATEQSMHRVGNGTATAETAIVADNFAVAVYGNMQPRVFRSFVKQMSQDGLIQRFIPALLREAYSDVKNEPVPDELTSAATYEQQIRLIHAIPPTRYRLSQGAYLAFRRFQDWYIALKKDERLLTADDNYMTALGKIEGTCGRIIFFWHLFEAPQMPEVSEDTARRAIEFTQTYLANALRYMYGEIGGSNVDSLDQYVRDYVMQHASLQNTVTLSEIRRSARRRVENMPAIQQDGLIIDAMEVLEKSNWVRKIEEHGRRITWAIDPRLADFFPEHRKAIIAAKQRRYDMIHAISRGAAPRKIVVGAEVLDDEG
jgi:hypothetical protein